MIMLMLMLMVMLMLMLMMMMMMMLLVVVVTMTMMTMMTMVMMVMRDSYQAVFLSMTETARRRTERMQEETRSTGSLVMTRVVRVCVWAVGGEGSRRAEGLKGGGKGGR